MIPSIHIIGSQHSGGAERFFARLVEGLGAKGNPVLSISRPTSSVAKDLATIIPQAHVPMLNNLDVWSRWRIQRIVKKRKPAIVQTYMGRATRLTHLPKSYRAIHVARLGGFYKLYGYRHADAWVGNTVAVCDYLRENGFPADRVFYVRNFVEPAVGYSGSELSKFREVYGIPRDAILLVAVGRLIEKKGFQDLLDAFSRLPGEIHDRPLYLMIVGDGPMESDLKNISRQKGIDKRVVWPGWQSKPDPFYALADIFVCPSRHEPLGNVILEAWSHGKPVCSTLTHGARELITSGVNGVLVPCENSIELAAALKIMLNESDAARSELGKQGKTRLVNEFSRDSVVDEYLDLYKRLVGICSFVR